MNKKIRGLILFVLGLFLAYILINRNGIQSSNTIGNQFFAIFLKVFRTLFGKTSWFVCIYIILWGIVDIVFRNIKLKFHKSKIVALIILFLSLSIFFTRYAIKTPLPVDLIEAGRKLLDYGFNSDSGGVIGAIVTIPFYRVVTLVITGILINTLIGLSIFILIKEFLWFILELLVELIKYYFSEDYKEKVQLLKAKKISEKEEYQNNYNQKKEEIRFKVIDARRKKIDTELAKKPKEGFLQKSETYSEAELIDKEREWRDLLEKRKEEKLSKIKRSTQIEGTSYDNTNVKKVGEIINQEDITENEENNDNNLENISGNQFFEEEIKKEDLNKKEKENIYEQITEDELLETIIDEDELEKRTERILKEKEEIYKKNEYGYSNNKSDLEINKDLKELDALTDYKKVNNEKENDLQKELDSFNKEDIENDELLKKSIEEIFKSKVMDPEKKNEIEKSILENVSHLESVLKEFGIEAKVVNYEYGPTITRYEIKIPKGVKVSKVTALTDDIAMNLAAESIRIEAPIPGKNTIGIETPNKIKEPVHFSNIIRNEKLEKGALNIILGKNIIGQDKIIDIAKMPHLLIAGQTGSGKSVAVNTLIATLITKKTEKEVRFIMIDPKMVELMPYNGIPHLLVPVIIDPHQAAIALKWAVNEMENRYRQLMENGVRNIEGYNNLRYVEKMPYIVIIIDELADLMMVAAGSVEESIARIAQKARAIGIHLVVATQRPSTDVITGMIKANLPSRISFALRSQIDSRTILDSQGAEKLLGKGDMLLLENGSSKLERIQGAFISDDEVFQLTNTLKQNRKVVYQEEILIDTVENNKDIDPYFGDAVEIIKREGKASISMLQRELKVGFNRASRIYNQLKENGIINEENQLLVDELDLD